MPVEYLSGFDVDRSGVLTVDGMDVGRVVLGTQEVHSDDDAIKPCECRHNNSIAEERLGLNAAQQAVVYGGAECLSTRMGELVAWAEIGRLL